MNSTMVSHYRNYDTTQVSKQNFNTDFIWITYLVLELLEHDTQYLNYLSVYTHWRVTEDGVVRREGCPNFF